MSNELDERKSLFGDKARAELERNYQVLVRDWQHGRTIASPEAKAAVAKIVPVQLAGAKLFLNGVKGDSGHGPDESVGEWWEWALERDGGFDCYDPQSSFSTWAWWVLKFKCLAYCKRLRRARYRMSILDIDVADGSVDPAAIVETRFVEEVLRQEVARLHGDLRYAILSKYFWNESSAEAAKKYNVQPWDLDRWRFQAREILRRRLRPLFPRNAKKKRRFRF